MKKCNELYWRLPKNEINIARILFDVRYKNDKCNQKEHSTESEVECSLILKNYFTYANGNYLTSPRNLRMQRIMPTKL